MVLLPAICARLRRRFNFREERIRRSATCIRCVNHRPHAGSAPAGPPVTDSSMERIITREVATRPKEPGGAAVAVRIAGRTLFFNKGMADQATTRPITSDSLFNLASLGKVFDATLLALAVRQGELSLESGQAPAAHLHDAGFILLHLALERRFQLPI